MLTAHDGGGGSAAVADYYEIYRLAKGQRKPINFPLNFLLRSLA